jgi:SanA protein
MMKLKYKKNLLYMATAGLLLCLAGTAVTVYANKTIEHAAAQYLYSDTATIPHNKAGLLLGTSRLLHGGVPNDYFYNRIDAAVILFRAHKIDNIVISGDNGKSSYNEPQDMKNELVARGIPENRIFLDYAGFRTYDSVYRMYHIFGQQQFTVISQEFHNCRAIYIAKALGLHAVGFNAKKVTAYYGVKTNIREKFARVKVLIDLMTGKQPKFLGSKINIP